MLFDPANIGRLVVPNRLVRSATAESMADEAGRPPLRQAKLYERLARGGVGLIITGHMYVHPTGKAHPGMVGIDADERIEDLAMLVEAAHSYGGLIAAQINHAGRQAARAVVAEPLAPSDAEATKSRAMARAMTVAEIDETIEAFALAAHRAKQAGFDAVQLHAAHGYLVSQFLSPLANRRTDVWGGDLSHRMRFFASVAAAVRAAVGEEYPVFAKLGICDEASEGLSLAEGCEVVASLREMSLDAVEISGGIAVSGGFNSVPDVAPGRNEAYFRPWARAAKASADVPILLVGGMRSRATMEDVLASGDAQFISLCRPLICEPDLPRRLEQGTTDASACVSGTDVGPKKGRPGSPASAPRL